MRTRYGRPAAVGALLLLVLGVSMTAQKVPKTADALYQEALLKKDAEGDLEGAITLFSKILADFSSDRRVAGLAQLQIGLCYEKLGVGKAEEAYRKVLADFGDQAEAVKVARERLSALTGAGATPAGERGLVFRKLALPEGKISPNGKYVAYETDGMTGVVFYDIESGKDHTVAMTPSEDGTCCYMVQDWLASSKSVLVEGFSPNSSRLKLVDVDGRNVRSIAQLDGLLFMASGGFSPDQKYLYVLVRSPDWSFHAVGRVSLEDGKYSEILNVGKNRAGSLGVSGDGKYLALTTFAGSDLLDSDIQIVSSDGQELRPLLTGPSSDKILGWMPDGRGILFSSTRGGEQAIWALPIDRGQASGDPVFVRAIKGFIQPSGFTNDGSFFYAEYSRGQDVYFLPIDFDAGKRSGEPVKLESVFEGRTRTPFWSPDGTSLAYIFATAQESDPYCRHILRIRSVVTGKSRDILLGFNPTFYLFAYGWASDGRSVILRGAQDGKTGLWSVDVTSGESKLLYESSRVAAWAADGNVVFESRPSVADINKAEFRIVRKDLRSGRELEIYRGKPGQVLSWMMVSPDEKHFSFRIVDQPGSGRPHTFVILPEGGGPEVERISDQAWGKGWSPLFFWGPRDKPGTVIVLRKGQEGERSEIWYYPLGSTVPGRKLELGEKVVWGELAFSPDGKFLAFSSDIKSETLFWSVENYLPRK